jgi:hypothetical protein
MLKEITTTQFDEWKRNLSPESDMPVITTSALIKLSELEDFIAQIKAEGGTGICVNLVRFTWDKDEPQVGKKTGNDNRPLKGCEWDFFNNTQKTQVALAISGTKNYKESPELIATADDIKVNGKISLLIPGGEKEGPTGHNPPSKTPGTGR